MSGVVQSTLEKKLQAELAPAFLEVLNESYMHSVPAGSETHFKVVIAAECFQGKTLVDRHREVYRILGSEMRAGVHALSIHAYTPCEWKTASAPKTPNCLGGKNEPPERA